MATKRYVLTLSTILAVVLIQNIEAGKANNTILDSKRRTDLVIDEGVLEQKDVLLDMLESKLREMKDMKKEKKKPERHSVKENGDGNCNGVFDGRCDLPKNVDMRLKSNGISAVGEVDVQMKYGKSGKGTLNLDASGISNVGKAQLDLVVGDGAIHIPWLDNLFVGKKVCLKNCSNDLIPSVESDGNISRIEVVETRRSNNDTIGNDKQMNDTLTRFNDTTTTINEDTTTNIEMNDTVVPTTDNDVIEIKSHASNSSATLSNNYTTTTGTIPQNITHPNVV